MRLLAIALLFPLHGLLSAQALPFKELNKWGIKDREKILVPARYDTVFTFDKNKQVCLVCFKKESTQSGKFIKVTNVNFSCNYLDSNGRRLVIRNAKQDTSSIFQLLKQTVKDYNNNDSVFKVSARNKKFLVKKNFKQLTFTPYLDIDLSDDPGFYVAQDLNEVDVPMYGLIDNREKLIIPFQYSGIRLNPSDSLVMVCGSGYGAGAEDFVFDYTGKKRQTFRHHVELATKEHIVFKIFEPKEHYIIFHIPTKNETGLEAEEVKYYHGNSIRIRLKNQWWVYNLDTGDKIEWKQ